MCEWYQDVFNYLKDGVFPITFDHNARIRLKKLATKYVIIGDLLYRRSFYGALLRCLMRYEVDMALHQAHNGECGGNFSAKFVYQKFLRLGYYWPTILEDYELHVNKCKQCQRILVFNLLLLMLCILLYLLSLFLFGHLILLVKLTLF